MLVGHHSILVARSSFHMYCQLSKIETGTNHTHNESQGASVRRCVAFLHVLSATKQLMHT